MENRYYIDVVKGQFDSLMTFKCSEYKEIYQEALKEVIELNKDMTSGEATGLFISLCSQSFVVDYDSKLFKGEEHSYEVVKVKTDGDAFQCRKSEGSVGGVRKQLQTALGLFLFNDDICKECEAYNQLKSYNFSDENFLKKVDEVVFRQVNDIKRFLPFLSDDGKENIIAKKILRNSFSGIAFNFAKSVTLGEFYILDDYSESYLNKIIEAKTDSSIPSFLSKLDFELVVEYIKAMASQVRTVSRMIGYILENQTSERKVHPVGVEGFYNHVQYSYRDLIHHSVYESWVDIIESLSLIAYIDFAYISTAESIETLAVSYNWLEKSLTNQDLFNDSLILKRFQDQILRPNMAKALRMIWRSCNLKDSHDEELERRFHLDTSLERLVHKDEEELFVGISGAKNCSFNKDKAFSLKYAKNKDVERYNLMGRTYCENRDYLNSLINEYWNTNLSLCSDDLKRIEKTIGEEKKFSPSFIIRIIQAVCNQRWDRRNLELVCRVARNLLSVLKMNLYDYKNGTVVPSKFNQPFFENYYEIYYSREKPAYKFSQIIPTKDAGGSSRLTFWQRIKSVFNSSVDENRSKRIEPITENTDFITRFGTANVTFFTSLHPSPVPLDYIEGFISKYDIIISGLERKREEEIWRNRIEEFKNSARQEVEKSQAHSLQLLGILGAFIALVSVGANSIKNIPTDHFLLFLLVITGCVVCLLISINAIFEEKKLKYLILIFLLASVLLTGTMYKYDWPLRFPGRKGIRQMENITCPCRQSQQDSLVLTGKALIFEKE